MNSIKCNEQNNSSISNYKNKEQFFNDDNTRNDRKSLCFNPHAFVIGTSGNGYEYHFIKSDDSIAVGQCHQFCSQELLYFSERLKNRGFEVRVMFSGEREKDDPPARVVLFADTSDPKTVYFCHFIICSHGIEVTGSGRFALDAGFISLGRDENNMDSDGPNGCMMFGWSRSQIDLFVDKMLEKRRDLSQWQDEALTIGLDEPRIDALVTKHGWLVEN